MQFQAIQFVLTLLLVYLPFGPQPLAETPIAQNSSAQNSNVQSPSKNSKDERRENQRVNKAQRELSQTRSELNDLQEPLEFARESANNRRTKSQ
jgi:hypothetical protein